MTTLADWSQATEDAQWYAIDSDGHGSFFTTKPRPVEGQTLGYWTFDNGGGWCGFRHNLNGADWRAAIEQRPQEAQP